MEYSQVRINSEINEPPRHNIEVQKQQDSLNFVVRSESICCYIHSTYDIVKEAEMAFRNVSKTTEFVVLFGFGCGFYLDYIAENFPTVVKVLVVEPTTQILEKVLSEINLNQKAQKINEVAFAVNKDMEDVMSIIRQELETNINLAVVYNVSYCSLFEDDYRVFASSLISEIRMRRMDILVSTGSYENWLINTYSNFAHDSIPVESIAKVFRGKTVVIVGAGPSLNKNMHLIEKLKDRAIIVAGGSAIKALEKNGITPHLRMACDGLEREKKLLLGMEDKTIPLIFTGRLHHEVLDGHDGLKFLLATETDFLWRYLYSLNGFEYLNVETAPSVTTIALNLFCQCNVSKVVLIGQDLCYSKGEVYAKGISSDGHFDMSKMIKTQDIHGEEVYTLNAYLVMRQAFSKIAASRTDIRIVNATEGGLGFEGVENVTLQNVIENELNEVIYFEEEMVRAFDKSDIGDEKRRSAKRVFDGLTQVRKELERAESINCERMRILEEMKLKFKSGGINPGNVGQYSKSIMEKEDMLESVGYYSEVVKKELAFTLNMFFNKYSYTGTDFNERIDRYLKMMNAIFSEIEKYLMISKRLIDKYFVTDTNTKLG